MKKMIEEMIKNKPNDVEIDNIMSFIKDILRYLEGEMEEEYETN